MDRRGFKADPNKALDAGMDAYWAAPSPAAEEDAPAAAEEAAAEPAAEEAAAERVERAAGARLHVVLNAHYTTAFVLASYWPRGPRRPPWSSRRRFQGHLVRQRTRPIPDLTTLACPPLESDFKAPLFAP